MFNKENLHKNWKFVFNRNRFPTFVQSAGVLQECDVMFEEGMEYGYLRRNVTRRGVGF